MSIKQPKIFIACADPVERQNLRCMLSRVGYIISGEAQDSSQALRMIRTLQPNLVLLDADLKGNALEVARIIEEDRVAPVILLTSCWHRNLMSEPYSVFAYVLKPILETSLLPTVEAALANYEKILGLEKEITKLKDTLAARKVVEKAKGILMDAMGLTEAEAYRRMQKQSMDRCVPMKSIAEAIIVAHELQSSDTKSK